jgi:small conductance mechanosensitive channel
MPEPQREQLKKLFDTHSQSWRDVGLARQLSRRTVRRARIQAIALAPVLAGTLVVYAYRDDIFGPDYETPVQIVTALVLVALGWQIARDVGRALAPALFRRLDPGTAGTVGFLIRLAFVGLAVILALRVLGFDLRTLAVGGAFTAVIVGLAAQQTLGNLIAGTVLLSARPFRVGERVRLQGGGIAGQIEGVVSSLGLLYTTFAQGDDQVMIPNSVVLNVAIVPLREPDSVDVRARLAAGVTPLEVQELLDKALETPVRDRPRITLEEIDGDEVVVRIVATPEHPSDGPRLASEVLEAVAARTTSADG